ncbi:hypothetical protein COB64_00645 [Candidatus Wolfebacteria bacterium]|nr:MAG: hypothetical protein COB64_00645 [Candidatus Wolfebacteria bacterium]
MKKLTLIIILISLVLIFISPLLNTVAVRRLFDSEQETFIPTFREVPIDFVHEHTLPGHGFAGGAVIDIDNDGVQEVFVGGSVGQPDALFSYKNGEFKNIIEGTGLSNIEEGTYGALSIDSDNDGDIDLFIARDSGVYMYINRDKIFSETKIELELEKNTIPIAIASGDINKDGLIDLYISTFIDPPNFKAATFNDIDHGKLNIMLLNKGDNTFQDITASSGLLLKQNTFVSSFIDLDNDGWLDLVLSPNTDSVKIYKNLRNLTFEEISSPTVYGFWMGMAVGDIDNDGDMDLFFSNAGKTIPKRFLMGDIRDDQSLDLKWKLLRNDGNFVFTDITKEKGVQKDEFAWGAIFEDFNLDGLQDLMVAENFVKWFPHKLIKNPGRFFVQRSNGNFVSTENISGVVNKYFGQSPLIADFNRDGYPDIIYVNFDGPLRAFLNEGGNNNYVAVSLQDIAESIGARVIVEKINGTRLTKQVITSTGLVTDQTPELFFGLGSDTDIRSIEVIWPSGRVEIIDDVQINSRIIIN